MSAEANVRHVDDTNEEVWSCKYGLAFFGIYSI